MAEPSERIMKFVGAARQEKGAEASQELGSLFYDKAAEKLDQFSKEIEFGTHDFAPPEGGIEDKDIDDALEADSAEDNEEVENNVAEVSQDDETESDTQSVEDSAEEAAEEPEEQVEEQPEENNGEETERDSSGSE